MSYEKFKRLLTEELNRYDIKLNNKTIAIIYKVLSNLNVID